MQKLDEVKEEIIKVREHVKAQNGRIKTNTKFIIALISAIVIIIGWLFAIVI